MYIEEHGAGRTVLLIQGCPSTTAYFQPLVAALSSDHRVLVPELPGYGRSPRLDEPYSLQRVQELLEDELGARGVREVAIVGYSIGGYRALALALTSQRVRVTHVVTLGGIAGFGEDVRAGFRQFAQMARDGFDFRGMWLGRVAGPGFADEFPEHVPDVMSWLDAAPRDVIADELSAIADAPDLRPRLRELAVPVTARVGERDAAQPPPFSEEIARGAPRGVLEVVAGRGHALLYEDRDATTRAVLHALARNV